MSDNNSPEQPPQGLQKLAPKEAKVSTSLGSRLRNYFLTGLIVVGPVGITIYIVWTFVSFVDSWVKPLLPAVWRPETYGVWLPGIGVLFSIIILMIIGALAANLFGRTVVSFGEQMVGRMPVVRGVYGALKQIFETVLSQSQTSFQKVGLIEYPRRGIFSIVFVSTETTGEIAARSPNEQGMLSIFLPTTPNPTSGFLLFLPKEDVILLEMSVEDAAKLVISAGLVVPDYGDGLQELADGSDLEAMSAAEAQAQIGEAISEATGEAENGTDASNTPDAQSPASRKTRKRLLRRKKQKT